MNLLDSLIFFIRVVEKKGVAAAGRDFGLSAATASARLAALEDHYEAKLLSRTTRSISLTDEGRILLESARNLVAETQDVETRIKLGVDQLSGPIRLSAPQDFGQRRIVPLIDSFMDENPNISIELQLTDDHIDLVGQGIDLAVRYGALKDSSLMVHKIADNRRVICASPAYIDRHGKPGHPDDLNQHDCLIMQFGKQIDREWGFKVNGRQRMIAVSGRRVSNNGAQVHKWCLEARGIALKSIFDVQEELAQGSLVELLADYAVDTSSALQLVYPGGGKPNRRVRALIDFLASSLR